MVGVCHFLDGVTRGQRIYPVKLVQVRRHIDGLPITGRIYEDGRLSLVPVKTGMVAYLDPSPLWCVHSSISEYNSMKNGGCLVVGKEVTRRTSA